MIEHNHKWRNLYKRENCPACRLVDNAYDLLAAAEEHLKDYGAGPQKLQEIIDKIRGPK